jgi:hypothetical protein
MKILRKISVVRKIKSESVTHCIFLYKGLLFHKIPVYELDMQNNKIT